MRGRIVASLALAVITLSIGGPALGAPFHEVAVEPIDETFVDVACIEEAPETIHTEGWARTAVVAADPFLLVHVTASVTQSWTETETGESFAGPVTAPWSFRVLPSGGENYSDVFTAIARGDEGTTAIFKSRFHVTVTPDGDVTVDLVRLSTTCR